MDDTIAGLAEHMEKGDTIIDGGNEWYENTERREKALAAKGILYLGMGVSGGEEGARNGPSMMPGGSREAYSRIEDVVTKVAAQVDGGACVTYIGPGGAGNFVKMVHNGIEYGDMQLISEAYDMLRTVGKLSNKELAEAFSDWNAGDLSSFLVEITAQIFGACLLRGPGARWGARALRCVRVADAHRVCVCSTRGRPEARQRRAGGQDPGQDGHEGHRQVDGAAVG